MFGFVHRSISRNPLAAECAGTRACHPFQQEVESVATIGRVSDSLFAIDHRTRRLSIFPHAASPSLSITLPLLHLKNTEYAYLEAILANGGAVSTVIESTGTASPSQTLYLHRRDGGQVQRILTFREGDFFASIRVGPLNLQFPQPLVIRPLVLYSPPSGRVAVLRTTVTDGGAAAVELTWLTAAAGAEVQRVAVPVVKVRRPMLIASLTYSQPSSHPHSHGQVGSSHRRSCVTRPKQ